MVPEGEEMALEGEKLVRPRKKASHLFESKKLGDDARRINNLAQITTANPMKTRNMTKKGRGRGYPTPLQRCRVPCGHPLLGQPIR